MKISGLFKETYSCVLGFLMLIADQSLALCCIGLLLIYFGVSFYWTRSDSINKSEQFSCNCQPSRPLRELNHQAVGPRIQPLFLLGPFESRSKIGVSDAVYQSSPLSTVAVGEHLPIPCYTKYPQATNNIRPTCYYGRCEPLFAKRPYQRGCPRVNMWQSEICGVGV